LCSSDPAGFALDLAFDRCFAAEGKRSGCAQSFTSPAQGRNQHHPRLAVLAEGAVIIARLLRSGNTGARGVVPFCRRLGALAGRETGCAVRADSGFRRQVLDFLREPFAVCGGGAIDFDPQTQMCRDFKDWDGHGRTSRGGGVHGEVVWVSKERRFVVVRERIRETKAAVGRQLIDVPGYTFRVWVTNRSEAALELWRDYNGRACVEQRIEELKHDLAADGFCLQPFFATERRFWRCCSPFNLLSLYQHQTTPDAPYRQPGTLRVAVFLCGAVLGVLGRDLVVKLSAAWGGLRKHKPLVAATLNWLKCASPEVDSARGPAGHRRRYDLTPRARSLKNYRSTSEFGLNGDCCFA